MGGFGSGNRWNHSARGTCEATNRVDIRYMREKGFLRPGREGTLSWSRGEEQTGWIRYRSMCDGLQLIYRARPNGGDWVDVNEHFTIEKVDQPFGGTRGYFVCNGCRGRCMVLYGGMRFRCRKCSNLSYASQNESVMDRACSKARRIRKRLGCEGNFDDPVPPKPKGMHWKTYDRLERQCEELEERVVGEFAILFGQMRGFT